MTDHLCETRRAYDTVAADYADLLRDELSTRPWERSVLGAFAELVGNGQVAELGCGPGRMTAHLNRLGVRIFGVDLSPGMIAVARRDHPHLTFIEADMGRLDRPDGQLTGIIAWYSIIHTPPERLPPLMAEFARLLAPGGVLLLAFQVGDERIRRDQAYGHPVAYDVYRLDPDRIAQLCDNAGLPVSASLTRAPEPPEPLPQAFVMATKRMPPASGQYCVQR